MIKLSSTTLKFAHEVGVTSALKDFSYSPEAIKLAYISKGMTETYADLLVKEAFWGTILRGAGSLSRSIPKVLNRAGSKALTYGTQNKGTLGSISNWLGKKTIGTGKTVGTALRGFSQAPGQTLWGGTKNFGKGLMFGGGTGVGGALGKGVFGVGTVATVGGMLGK